MVVKLSKRQEENMRSIQEKDLYSAEEAVAKIKTLKSPKFDESVEIIFNLGVDPKKNDQQVRGTVPLPAGLGKDIKVVVIASGDKIKEAEEAGASIVGSDDLVEKINGGFTDFDVLLATPDMMSKVGKLGKVLGRKGLMPTPKTGTVTMEIKSAVTQFKAGKVEYKVDKYGIIHIAIGKVSFENSKLLENYNAIYEAVAKAKPTSVKGIYMKSVYLCSAMGPSCRVEVK